VTDLPDANEFAEQSASDSDFADAANETDLPSLSGLPDVPELSGDDVEVVDVIEVAVQSEIQPLPEMRPAMRPVAAGRREARERAVHLLYESAMKGIDIEGVLAQQAMVPEPYTVEVVRGVGEHGSEIDALISRLSRGWTIDRMPVLDLAVLRVACLELAYRSEIPTGVILSEATDLATQYGTDDSSRFVNGVLAAASRELRTV